MDEINRYELARETLEFYFDTPFKETLKKLPSPHDLVEYLKEHGADQPEERARAIEFIFVSPQEEGANGPATD